MTTGVCTSGLLANVSRSRYFTLTKYNIAGGQETRETTGAKHSSRGTRQPYEDEMNKTNFPRSFSWRSPSSIALVVGLQRHRRKVGFTISLLLLVSSMAHGDRIRAMKQRTWRTKETRHSLWLDVREYSRMACPEGIGKTQARVSVYPARKYSHHGRLRETKRCGQETTRLTCASDKH